MADLTRTVAVDVDDVDETPVRGFRWPWYLSALVGGIGVALAGWVLLAGVSVLAWLGQTETSFSSALVLATQGFALAHGVPVAIAGQPVSLIPLGLTALLIFLAMPVVSYVARAAADAQGEEDADGIIRLDRGRLVITVAGTHAGVYTITATALVGLVLGSAFVGRALLGSLLVGALASLWGAARAVGYDVSATWPHWLRAVPRAMLAAVLVVTTMAAVLLALASWQGRARIADITAGLAPDWMGIVALGVIHLLYLPNLILWSCSWLLGAGVSLGDGSLLSMAVTDVGLLPAIPALGAVPEPGPGSAAMLWWFVPGAVAGIVAGVTVALARPRARFDETSLVGGLSGVAAGLLLTALAHLGSGALGADRLAHIGARVDQLLVFAPTLLGLAGMAGGLIVGLLRRPPKPASDDASRGAAEDEPHPRQEVDHHFESTLESPEEG